MNEKPLNLAKTISCVLSEFLLVYVYYTLNLIISCVLSVLLLVYVYYTLNVIIAEMF